MSTVIGSVHVYGTAQIESVPSNGVPSSSSPVNVASSLSPTDKLAVSSSKRHTSRKLGYLRELDFHDFDLSKLPEL